MQRAIEKLKLVVPLTVLIITLLLYLAFRCLGDVLIVLVSLPVAVVVGIIALAGVAVEIGVIMLTYLNQYRNAYMASSAAGQVSREGLKEAVSNGALQRLRPIVMTVAAITAGLLPIMIGHGTGSEVMQRIAAPMIGGMLTTLLLTLCMIPALFLVWRRWTLNKTQAGVRWGRTEGQFPDIQELLNKMSANASLCRLQNKKLDICSHYVRCNMMQEW